MTILTQLTDEDARLMALALQELLDLVLHSDDRRLARSVSLRIDPRDQFLFGLVPAEDLFQGEADLAHRCHGTRCRNRELEEVSFPGAGTLGKRAQRRGHRRLISLRLELRQP